MFILRFGKQRLEFVVCEGRKICHEELFHRTVFMLHEFISLLFSVIYRRTTGSLIFIFLVYLGTNTNLAT